jgi:tight adherence protein B
MTPATPPLAGPAFAGQAGLPLAAGLLLAAAVLLGIATTAGRAGRRGAGPPAAPIGRGRSRPARTPPAATGTTLGPSATAVAATGTTLGATGTALAATAVVLAGTGVVLAAVLPRLASVVLPAGVGAGAVLLLRVLRADSGRLRRERLLTDLPLALDLVAACLRSGATVPAAVETVGVATGGPLGEELLAVARAMRLGAAPVEACHRLLDAARGGDGLAGLLTGWTGRTGWLPGFGAGPPHRPPPRVVLATVRALGRADESGARLATTLSGVAERAREDAHAATIAAARRAGVAAVAPLGLCFLPAFLLIGVVPVVLGSAHGLLPG